MEIKNETTEKVEVSENKSNNSNVYESAFEELNKRLAKIEDRLINVKVESGEVKNKNEVESY